MLSGIERVGNRDRDLSLEITLVVNLSHGSDAGKQIPTESSMCQALGGLATAIILAAIAVPDKAWAQPQDSGIHYQVVGETFSSARRVYRHYNARRYWVPSYYVSNYRPYFYYAPLHYYAPPPGLRYYGPRPGSWSW